MTSSCTQVHRFGRKPAFDHWCSGVSLHSHTMHSKEYLGRLPGYIDKFPIGGYILQREIGRVHLREGRIFDFNKIYWTPPLSPREADELERQQIEKTGLAALVSLSDHDSIAAGKQLRMLAARADAPISVEWTVPYDHTEFHIGVHNLPPSTADAWMRAFAECTANTRRERVRELLSALREQRNTLVVLNHPYWDAAGIGSAAHRDVLDRFLCDVLPCIHAFELNGMRSRKENREVLLLGEALDVPVISGGDRHGLEPNVVLNVSRAATFEDFVDEIRNERRSEILLMPPFFDPLPLRLLENAYCALCDAPGEFGRGHWMTRIFIEENGEARAVSHLAGTRFQSIVEKFRWIMGLVANPVLRPAFRVPFVGYEEGGL